MIFCIGHTLSSGGGYAFVCQENGCARIFETVGEADEHINEFGLDRLVWNIVGLAVIN